MKPSAGILVLIVFLSASVFGDVAPDPGFRRITVSLTLETDEELSGFRFFVKSGGEVEEVFIKPGERTVVSPLGGGAYYSAGKLLAVPREQVKGFNSASSDGKLSELEKAVYDGTVPGSVELVDHLFSRTVNESEAGGFRDPLYRIERDLQSGLKAVHISGGAATSAADTRVSSGRLFWQSAGAAIVAGIFLMFGIATLGILYFRKRTKAL